MRPTRKNMPNKLSDDKQRISASLPKKLVAQVRAKAKRRGITFTDAVREALADFVSAKNFNSTRR